MSAAIALIVQKLDLSCYIESDLRPHLCVYLRWRCSLSMTMTLVQN